MISSTTTIPGVHVNYDIHVVGKALEDSTKHVLDNIMQTITKEREAGLSFKELAEKNINPKLKEELAASDEKIQKAYEKLYANTLDTVVEEEYKDLELQLTKILVETGDEDTVNDFIGSFVFAEVNNTAQVLEKKAPGALEHKEIWTLKKDLHVLKQDFWARKKIASN